MGNELIDVWARSGTNLARSGQCGQEAVWGAWHQMHRKSLTHLMGSQWVSHIPLKPGSYFLQMRMRYKFWHHKFTTTTVEIGWTPVKNAQQKQPCEVKIVVSFVSMNRALESFCRYGHEPDGVFYALFAKQTWGIIVFAFSVRVCTPIFGSRTKQKRGN